MDKQSNSEQIEIKLPTHNKAVALFNIAIRPWVAIVITWAFFFISLALSWEVPASGAVMVCGALIAEIFYQNQTWTKLNVDPSGSVPLKPNADTGSPVIWGKYVVWGAGKGKMAYLLSLAKSYEVKFDSNGKEATWYYRDTVMRVEKLVLYTVVITAVSGTIVWGYGHLIFK